MGSTRLVEHRHRIERAWNDRFGAIRRPAEVRPEILSSWERSAVATSLDLRSAPVDESIEPVELWRASPLRPAIEAVEDEIRELAESRGFVAAVMDDVGRLVWTVGGPHMQRRAERVNFAPGARWDEASVGTNALALALDAGRPAEVFSAEHYAAMVHGWCCFAAPLREPTTGRPLGVLDLSSTWDRAHPMALSAVRALAMAAQAVLDAEATDRDLVARQGSRPCEAQVRVLGISEVRRAGTVTPLALRQAEIVALLALADHGLTPEELHDQLHGYDPGALVTTKADVSHLRTLLGGAISYRRYRLGDIAVDVARLLAALRAGAAEDVARLYRGPLLPASDAPGVREWREVFEVAVRDLAISSGLPALAERMPHDVSVQQAAAAVLDPGDVRAGWARARVVRAQRE